MSETFGNKPECQKSNPGIWFDLRDKTASYIKIYLNGKKNKKKKKLANLVGDNILWFSEDIYVMMETTLPKIQRSRIHWQFKHFKIVF